MNLEIASTPPTNNICRECQKPMGLEVYRLGVRWYCKKCVRARWKTMAATLRQGKAEP